MDGLGKGIDQFSHYQSSTILLLARFNVTTFLQGLILLVVFLLLWGGHWLPWRVLPVLVDERGDLKRVPAYVYGTLCIIGGYAAWCVVQAHLLPLVDVWQSLAWLVMVTMAAGLGTVTPRVLRWVLDAQATKGDLEDLQHGPAKR